VSVFNARYSVLEGRELDEVPLVSEDGGVVSDEEETIWEASGTRWRRRIQSHSTLVSLLFNGGWSVVLKKSVKQCTLLLL